MKTTLVVLTFLASVVLWFSCKNSKYTPGNFPDKQLRWGSGGGIAGKETSWTLLDNGQIFVREMGGNLQEAGKTKSKNARALYELIEKTGLDKRDFQHPGNTYDFIEVLNGDSVNRISWGDRNIPVDDATKDLFKRLNALLKK